MILVSFLSIIIKKKKPTKTLGDLSAAEKKKLFKKAAIKANEMQYDLMNN